MSDPLHTLSAPQPLLPNGLLDRHTNVFSQQWPIDRLNVRLDGLRRSPPPNAPRRRMFRHNHPRRLPKPENPKYPSDYAGNLLSTRHRRLRHDLEVVLVSQGRHSDSRVYHPRYLRPRHFLDRLNQHGQRRGRE